MTTTSKPKPKFSSRNLSAVFKAPLRTKPLPDNATGPLPRTSNRLLVLGRATTAPPAPINTPSMLKESQTHDVPVSLVPAASNWATNAAVLTETNPPQDQKEKEIVAVVDHGTKPADPAVPSSVADKAWTPESVAEHLHTTLVVHPPVIVESSGRWGDDEVENDIVQSNFRRQRQKERDFPNLKEAAEETHGHNGHAPAAEHVSPSMHSQPSQQHYGRATGRWAHFNEQEEMYHPRSNWSRDSYSRDKGDGLSRDHYARDEDNRWSCDHFSQRDESGGWSRDRYSRDTDGYGRMSLPSESSHSNQTVSPIPNDRHTHFSSSDVRFDMVASGDHVLSHSPRRMDWNGGLLDRRDARPPPMFNPQESRCHAPVSMSSSLTPISPFPVSPPLSAAVAPARAQNWRRLPPADRGSDRTSEAPCTNAWPKDQQDTPSTPVATAATSSTGSSSGSSTSSSPTSAQHVQPLNRPKMLFDPKTGGMVNAEETSGAGKRLVTNGGRGRESANTIATSEPISATQLRKTAKASSLEDKQMCKSKGRTGKIMMKMKEGRREKDVNAVLSAPTEVVQHSEDSSANKDAVKDAACGSETSHSITSDALQTERKVGGADATAKSKANNTEFRIAKSERDGTPVKSPVATPRQIHPAVSNRITQPAQRRAPKNISEGQPAKMKVTSNERVPLRGGNGKAAEHGKRPRGGKILKDDTSTQTVRRTTGGKNISPNPPDSTEKTGQLQPKLVVTKAALLTHLAAGASSDVVVGTGDQEGAKVQPEDNGFETVKSRRTILSERKQLRQRLGTGKAAAHTPKQAFANGKKSARGSLPDEQSKGEEAQEDFGFCSSKGTASKSLSKPRGKVASPSSTGETVDIQVPGANNRENLKTSEQHTKGSNKQTKSSAKNAAKKLGACLKKNQRSVEASVNDKTFRKERISKRDLKQVSAKVYKNVGLGGASRTCLENEPTASSVGPIQQAAGEAATESPMSKRRPQVVRATTPIDTKREQTSWKENRTDQLKKNRSRPSTDRKTASVFETQKQERSKHQGSNRSTRIGGKAGDSTDRVVEKVEVDISAAVASTTKKKFEMKSRAASTKARPKQIKQVYVVKTPAPAPTGATSTAA